MLTGYYKLTQCFLQTILHVGITMFFAITIGIILGVIAYKVKWLEQIIIILTNILQTTPAFAVLVLFVPILGTGLKPTIVAMFIVSVLPIFKNTFAGLKDISAGILEAAEGMGMTNWQKLRLVELPLIIPVIMAGIRMSTVICVGMSILAAYIGAGGLGYFIRYGLALGDTRVLIMGIIPSSLLAITFNYLLGIAEKDLQKRVS